MEEKPQRKSVYLISDGTGETAWTMTRAALVQFKDADIHLVRCKNIRTDVQLESSLAQAAQAGAFVIHTMVSPKLRKLISEYARKHSLQQVDLLGPLLEKLEIHFGGGPSTAEAGLLRSVDEKYFKRIEAIEFTVKHDDGKSLHDLSKADIVLVGVSRTSKTPLSIFLSHKGWKVANVPLIMGSPPPEELFEIDQRRIVALTIDPDSLYRIRRSRLDKLGTGGGGGGHYAQMDKIQEEIDWALSLFSKNKKWPLFNVTERALEETAGEITRLVSTRLGLQDPLLA